jgi:hypothetical protein
MLGGRRRFEHAHRSPFVSLQTATMSLLFAKHANSADRLHVDAYRPEMKGSVVCPACEGALVAKCGGVMVHHYAHRKTCTVEGSRTEAMGEWHLSWQNLCLPEYQEITKTRMIDGRPVTCRSDIVTSDGGTIEIQHSNISAEKMWRREECHENMIWVVDARTSRPVRDCEGCKSLSCTQEHSPVRTRVESQQGWVIFEVMCGGLAFPFAARKPVYLDTVFGLYRLRQKLYKTNFLATRIHAGHFFDEHFKNISHEAPAVLATKYEATCRSRGARERLVLEERDDQIFIRGEDTYRHYDTFHDCRFRWNKRSKCWSVYDDREQ